MLLNSKVPENNVMRASRSGVAGSSRRAVPSKDRE